MTWIQLAQEEASKFGVTLSDKDADVVLWEFTGFPGFWNIPQDGNTPEECCRKQLRELFAENETRKPKPVEA